MHTVSFRKKKALPKGEEGRGSIEDLRRRPHTGFLQPGPLRQIPRQTGPFISLQSIRIHPDQ